ncbi:LAQU0S08e04500g1_1 [Lachancea quebecensis]|uniref:LAQU0S08e04500g1_1 n=1 Tax=Lachancea quebecensis TaxID=1654605 RepID=A0A0P1KT57_9SACH|nr:LAQU0S08e04500g1_1 [Lachancea quebecensis]
MRASTRVNVTNRLFVTTFLVAFSSVALGSMLPCPAHTLDSDAPLTSERPAQKRDGVAGPHRKQQ